MSQLRAILFDFDGCIVDSEPLHFESFCEVLSPFDITVDQGIYNDKYLGFNDYEVLEMLREDRDDVNLTDEQINEMVDKKTVWMQDNLVSRNPLLPGSAETIRAAHENGIKLAVCSGALREEVVVTLQALGLIDCFESIIGAEDVECGKPHPMGYLLSAERLGVQPCECVIIEDSPIGLSAAKAAGIKACGLTTTYDEAYLTDASLIAPNLSNITLDDLATLVK